MTRTITRSVPPALGLAVVLAGFGLTPLGEPTRAAAAPTAITSAERQAVEGFYAAQSFANPSQRNKSALPGTSRVTSTSEDTYFRDFYNSYAENPGVEVRSLQVRSKVLSKKATASATQYTVSVSVEFGLYDKEARQSFTGGETMDHVFTVATAGVGTKTLGSSAAMTVVADRSLGVSTAPNRIVDDPAEIPTVDPSYVIPADQLKKKRTAAANRLSATEVSAKAANPFPRLDYQKMVDYAAKWTDNNHKDIVNTDPYPKLEENNCTNFVSQSLHQGGWKIKDTTYPFRKKLKYWDYNMTGPGKMTWTWSVAQSNYERLTDQAKLSKFDKMENAWLADIVYFDWNVRGSEYGGGLDHAMITTRIINGKPYFSQKSGNRHNVPVKEVKRNIKDGGGTKYKVYGLRT